MGRFADIDTRDPAVTVSTWFLVVVAALSVLIRLGTKWWIFRKLTNDDSLIIVSLALCIAQSVTISTAVSHGYGDHFSTVSTADFAQVMKCQYAASILYIASLCLSKLSLSTFIRNLTPVHRDHFLATILQIAITIVGVIGVIGTAFQCHLPRPWDYWREECFDLHAWAYFLCAAHIATDVAIIVQSLVLIFGIQATLTKKAVFGSVFLSRIFVILPLIAEIILTQDAHRTDPTYASCYAQIASQVVQSASILTACWGQVKPFLNQLKSNGLRIRGVEYDSSYPLSSGRKQSHGSGNSGRIQGENYNLVPVTMGQTETTVQATSTSGSSSQWWDRETVTDMERDSRSPSYSSRTAIIRETRSWAVSGGRANSN
ncbi:hypothetical protein BDV19DRAFT_390361 [Aspergillus venezuelensis]